MLSSGRRAHSISDLFCPCWVEYMSPRTTGWKQKWPHFYLSQRPLWDSCFLSLQIQGSVRASTRDTVRVSLNYKLQLTPGTLASCAEGPAERRGIGILVGRMEPHRQEIELLFSVATQRYLCGMQGVPPATPRYTVAQC